ncbi:uncharacterized protein PAE49_000335 isoform 2-T2 [Odontesthes bonariensis]
MPSTTSVPPCPPQTSTPISAEKTMKMPHPPEYVVYTDSELDLVRSQYFALLRNGKEKGFKMSKELCCRLLRNTIASMVAILRASPMGKEASYPSKLEMKVMSQKIIEYYPMLRDATANMPYAMDELRRIVDGTSSRYIEEVKGRWTEFCTKVQFYSVWKKVLKPPFPLDVRSVDFTLALFKALPPLFPSPVLPPKKLACSEALIHILKSNEDPVLYLQKCPLCSQVLLFDGSTTIVAVTWVRLFSSVDTLMNCQMP